MVEFNVEFESNDQENVEFESNDQENVEFESNDQEYELGYVEVLKGDKGDAGEDGFSPIAKVERVEDGALITITDKEGTTETMVHDGQGASTWEDIENKPFNSVGQNLKVVNGALSVDTTDEVEEDNTRPITSAGTYVVVGNINSLLELI